MDRREPAHVERRDTVLRVARPYDAQLSRYSRRA